MTTIMSAPEEQPLAHYYHASLYRFTVLGRIAILDAFYDKVGPIAATCAYHVKKDLFELHCPTADGAFCDEALHESIDSYIMHELAAAKREQREPQARIFDECQWEVDWDAVVEESRKKKLGFVDDNAPPPSGDRPVTAHIVVSNASHLKLFRMTQLPEIFIKRALSTQTAKSQKVFSYGVTCRTVTWRAGEGWVFNGRDGVRSSAAGSVTEQLDLTKFSTLSDTRGQAVLAKLGPEVKEGDLNRWRRHAGDAPDIRSWLQGIRETSQDSPEEAAELPNEPTKIPRADEMHGNERTRRPMGHDLGSAEQDSSSDEEQDAPRLDADFAGLMPSRSFANSDTLPVSEYTVNAMPGSLIPLNENIKPRESTSAMSASVKPKRTPSQQVVHSLSTNSPGPHSSDSLSIVPSSTGAELDAISQYDGKYAKVDSFGLVADPGLTATYALENFVPSPLKPNSKHHPVMPRSKKSNTPAPTEISGQAASIRSKAEALIGAKQQVVDSDVPADRLAEFSPSFGLKRNTMKQKAGKNVKSKGKKSANANCKAPKIELPMPDPLPAPRVKKIVEGPQSRAVIEPPSVSTQMSTVRNDDLSSINGFSQLVFDIIEEAEVVKVVEKYHDVQNGHKLVLQFGQLLSLPKEKDLKQQAGPPAIYQELMTSSKIASTSFFPGLTTSASDASLLIELIGAGKKPKLVYEVHVTDIAGWSLKCTIPDGNKSAIIVETKDQAAGYEFLHFPEHVWDARIGLVRSGVEHKSFSHEAIVHFVSSMRTADEGVPCFYAFVPPGRFVLDAVIALRVWEDVNDGITCRVSEMQNLVLERFNGGRYNCCATALVEPEMINSSRMWYEAKLETPCLDKVEDLRAIVTPLIAQMDGIGLENIGPWNVGDADDDDKGSKIAKPVLPFDELGRSFLEDSNNRF